jgi:hypothetical protein
VAPFIGVGDGVVRGLALLEWRRCCGHLDAGASAPR